MAKAHNPHDAQFKASWSTPERAAAQFRALLPRRLVAQLNFSTLTLCSGSFVNEALRPGHCDLLFQVELGSEKILVYVLYEHQSTCDPLRGFWLLCYMVAIWKQWLEQHKHESPRKLPPILPLVLYHGKEPWTAARRFSQLIDLPEELSDVLRYLPEFEYLLDDLSESTDEELVGRGGDPLASLTLILFRQERGRGEWLETLRTWAPLFRALRQQPNWRVGLSLLIRYILSVGDVAEDDLGEFIALIMGSSGKEVVVSTLEKLIEERKPQWLLEGEQKGLREGKQKGLREGKRAGLLEGKQKGLLEGKREALTRLLRARFGAELPAAVVERVQTAAATDLDLWTDRVLTAASLDEVFGA